MVFVALAIFAVTLVLVIWQPKGLGIGWSALGGAVLALATGVVAFSDVPVVWDLVWNATFAFVAIVIISLLLDEAGLFEWAALHVARWGRGNGRVLFALIVLLGAAIATVFANDGAALILTPIVIQMLVALRFPAAASLAFVMACGFVADAGSLPLVVSNLVNIVTADFFDIGFARYAQVMVPVGIVAVAASLGMLLLYFRRSIPRSYDVSVLASPSSAVRDHATFRAGWVVLAVLLVGYFAAEPLHIPLSVIAGAGAIVLMIVAGRPHARGSRPGRQLVPAGGASSSADGTDLEVVHDDGASSSLREERIPVLRVLREAPWQIVLFSIGMYLVVYGLRNEGVTDQLSTVFAEIGSHGALITALGVGTIVAVLASLMNNMPTVLIAALAISGAGATGLTHEAMIYANVIGSDLGPKITPIGSLATLLWLHVLQRKGITITWGQYFRTGIVLTIPVLAVTLLALAGWLTLLAA
ncbi:arsenic transporter [Agrococcus sp. TSP3-2-1]|uniref:arsenic transporter n=1 Tax=Agrococcus sp. TSP3-2-1 TaxID=2804583 RepID=UPI003CF4D48D